MIKGFGTFIVVLMVIAATVTVTRFSDDIVSAFTSWTDSSAQVPGLIPFQGVLTDSSGNLVEDDNYTVAFAFYSVGTGGISLWSETQVVSTTSGIFSAQLGSINSITPSTVASDELWLGITVESDPEMTPRQRVGSAVYALVAGQLANPKNPEIILSHDGIMKQSITCSTPRNTLVVWGSGFESGESIIVTAIGGGPDGSDADILTTTADSNGTFMVQGSSSASAIPCTSSGLLTVKASGDKGNVSSIPVLISATPTPGPTATPTVTPIPVAVTVSPTPIPNTTVNSQILTEDTTWGLTGSPYLVKGNVRVDEGVTLTIEPGVDLRFNPGVYLDILGTIQAVGTPSQQITFESQVNNYSSWWGGICFQDQSTDYEYSTTTPVGSIIKYSIIGVGTEGGQCNNGYLIGIDSSSPKISYSQIALGPMAIGVLGDASPIVTNNTFFLPNDHPDIVKGIHPVYIDKFFYSNTIHIQNSGDYSAGGTPVKAQVTNNVGIGQIIVNAGATNSIVKISGNTIFSPQGEPGLVITCGEGFYISGGASCDIEVSSNTIQPFYNGDNGTGIWLRGISAKHPGDFSFTDNVIKDYSTGISISYVSKDAEAREYFSEMASQIAAIIPLISRTDFIGVTSAVVLNNVDSSVTIPVSDSYWGTTNLEEISDMIYDNLDDFNLGTVQVVNPVSSPVNQ
tara:strand:+ start:2548 stop:4596 length:2049 start_codon:yes stop_codon:yes gene_type:complete